MSFSTSPITRATAPGSARERAFGGTRLLALLVVVQCILRVTYLFHHSVDSDEPQHLHVIWGWTHGLVQYRDLFDNHAPLFHLLMTPVLALFDERADIVVLARLSVFPLVALSVWAIYRLGTRLWSRRVAAWAVLVAAFDPTWLLTSGEFRTDILWMAAWLCAILTLLGGPRTVGRGLLGGLCLGIALAASLKTTLLIGALASAGLLLLLLRPHDRARWIPEGTGRYIGAIAAGLVLVPAIVVAGFWSIGALPAMLYCTIQHNIVPNLGLWGHASHRALIVPATLVVVMPIAYRLLRERQGGEAMERRVMLLLCTALYVALLEGMWPLITSEDYLPWVPMAALIGVVSMGGLSRQVAVRRRWSGSAFKFALPLLLLVAGDLVSIVWREPPWNDASAKYQSFLGDVLRLTRPHERIMDLKGETVFRPRPCYYVLEGVTKTRIAKGLYPDRIARDIERTRTHYAAPDDEGFPPVARQFLNRHFMPEGLLRVLGTDLGTGRADSARAFDVSYAEDFAILADGFPGRGNLDGNRYRGPRRLEPGSHRYWVAPGESHVIAVWSKSRLAAAEPPPLAGILK